MSTYDVHSKFDIEQHKKTYPYYTEVVIHPDGEIEYAVPSHQEKLISICMRNLNVTRNELNNMCPKEFYADFNQWLCNVSHRVSVWYDFSMFPSDGITIQQKEALKMLKANGCYVGKV